MKHDKTFEAIAKLKDIEIELRRLKSALEITNKALDASVPAEREACAKACAELLSMDVTGDEYMDGVVDCIAAIRARGEK
jgi:hypothetical protein